MSELHDAAIRLRDSLRNSKRPAQIFDEVGRCPWCSDTMQITWISCDSSEPVFVASCQGCQAQGPACNTPSEVDRVTPWVGRLQIADGAYIEANDEVQNS